MNDKIYIIMNGISVSCVFLFEMDAINFINDSKELMDLKYHYITRELHRSYLHEKTK